MPAQKLQHGVQLQVEAPLRFDRLVSPLAANVTPSPTRLCTGTQAGTGREGHLELHSLLRYAQVSLRLPGLTRSAETFSRPGHHDRLSP